MTARDAARLVGSLTLCAAAGWTAAWIWLASKPTPAPSGDPFDRHLDAPRSIP